MRTFWISFANDEENLGVFITDAEDEQEALVKAMSNGDPGGQAIIIDITAASNDVSTIKEVLELGKDRLVTPEELKALGKKTFNEHTKHERRIAKKNLKKAKRIELKYG